jgi:hypothetical protein
MTFNVPPATDFDIVVSEVTANAGCPAYTLTLTGCPQQPEPSSLPVE